MILENEYFRHYKIIQNFLIGYEAFNEVDWASAMHRNHGSYIDKFLKRFFCCEYHKVTTCHELALVMPSCQAYVMAAYSNDVTE